MHFKFILIFTFLTVSLFSKSQSLDDLNKQLFELYKSSEYEKAIPIAEKVKIIALQKFGNKDTTYANTLKYLGVLSFKTGRYSNAESQFIEAKNIYKNKLGTENIYYAVILNNIAALYDEMGLFDKAEPFYNEVLKIYDKIIGFESSEYYVLLNNWGLHYYRKREFKKAESLFNDVIEFYVRIKSTDAPNYIQCLSNLALVYDNLGEYYKSEDLYKEVLSLYKQTVGIENPYYAIAINNLGLVYNNLGEYNKAEPLFIEGAKINKKVFGEKHPNYAMSLINIAMLYKELGNYDKAGPLFYEALDILRKAFGEDNPEYSTTLNKLGILFFLQGRYKDAERLLVESLNIQKKIFTSENPEYAASLTNLGMLYSFLEEYPKAEPLLLEAARIFKKTLGTEHLVFATSLNNLGVHYSYIGNYDKSVSYLNEALNIQKNVLGINNVSNAETLINLATLNYKFNRIEESIKYLDQAIFIYKKQILINFDFLSEQEKLEYFKEISYVYEMFNSIIYTDCFLSGVQESPKGTDLYNQEIQNKGLVLRSSMQLKNSINRSGDSSEIKLWNSLIELKDKLSKFYSLPLSNQPADINTLESEATSIEKRLALYSKEYRASSNQVQADWKSVQKMLNPNEAALEFISFEYYSPDGWTDSTIYAALILKADSPQPQLVYLFEERQILPIIKKESGTLDQTYLNRLYQERDGSSQLYNLIWQPLDKFLQGIATVYVAPSGLLHKIALGAIPTPDGKTIKSKYGLEILGTTADIINRREEFIDKQAVQRAYIFGGINYEIASSKPINFNPNNVNNVFADVPTDSTRGESGKWNYLGGTFSESEEIANKFRAQNITTSFYSDSIATETLFKNMPVTGSSIFHIATHGYFFPDIKRKKDNGIQLIGDEKQTAFRASENPLLRSGLIFAGANPAWTNPDYVSTASDDGILTAYEISNMDLSNVKLVVLSACETGLGDIKGSEGVFGLQRAFKLAGVKNIIMSLWKVPDEKTRELMQSFYQFCFDGKSIGDAFKSAQEMMRTKYPTSPYYWAGFTLLQ